MKPKLQTWPSVATLALLLANPIRLGADVVSDWNAITVQATITGARPVPTGVLDTATVHAAV